MLLLCIAILVTVIPPPHPSGVETPLPPHCREEQYPSHATFVPNVQGEFSEGKGFQVNEDPPPAVFDQINPTATSLQSGEVVTAWCDERNGDYDIFYQIFAVDGTALGGNLVASDELGSSLQYDPAVGEYAHGFVICWVDHRDGNADIYGRLFSPAGDPLGSSFELSDADGESTQASPSVAPIGDGGFLVCWEDGRGGDLDIYGQICDSIGRPQGANFRISDDSGDRSQRHPSVGSDSSGAFFVVWRDYRAGLYPFTFGQRFDPVGTPLGSNFMVCDHISNNAQWNPSVAVDPAGNVLVVCEDWRNGNYDIFGQKYDSSGNPCGPNFLISADVSGSEQTYPSVAASWQDGFLVAWIDLRDGGYDIYAQHLGDGVFQDDLLRSHPFRVNDVLLGSQLYPAVTSSRKGDFTIDWIDSRGGTWDIYGQRYRSDGDPSGANFLVNGDRSGSSQLYPSVASSNDKRFCVGWLDPRSGNYDVYVQILLKEDGRTGRDILINDDTSQSHQWAPSVAAWTETTFVVVWDDYRNAHWDIYGQMYRWDGSPAGVNFIVNDDILGREQGFCTGASSPTGDLILVWLDKRDEGTTRWDVYGQRFDGDGRLVGSNFKLNDDGVGNDQRSASVASSPEGNFCGVWMDTRNDEYDIYGQRYDSEGTRLGVNFMVNDDGPGNTQKSPSAAYDSDGSLWVVWADARSGDYDIYAQQYDSSGLPIGENIRVNDDPGLATQEAPAISGSGGHLIISWTDYRNGSANADVYAQRFQEGVRTGDNYRVNTDRGYKYQGESSVSTRDGYIYHAWRDSRVPGQGYDVFAKIEAFEGQERQVSVHRAKRISRLYPVRRSVQGFVIEFDLEDYHSSVGLRIYGPDGRQIRTLYDGACTSGSHRVVWDLRDDHNRKVAPGIYFCTLGAGSIVDRQKIVVLQ